MSLSMQPKCRWILPNGNRCPHEGKYIGIFCKKHCISEYIYNPDGIDSEGCGNVLTSQIYVDCIKTIEAYSDRIFIGVFVGRGKAKYEYHSSAITYVTMINHDTREKVIFWKDSETRGKKGGFLINTLCTEPCDDYCENLAVCKIDDEFFCTKCFELTFKGKIRSLRETCVKKEKEAKKCSKSQPSDLSFSLDSLTIDEE